MGGGSRELPVLFRVTTGTSGTFGALLGINAVFDNFSS